ncbi:hypothetical protein [Sulfuricaulis limicola]|uniref:hypothetical protein n=1 Tax=Sulfuricaulis limicola TaxID=1620215 RepID=UPI001557354A|nr:hypothetical protein [Sulfuricaulis limicola]
MILNRHNFVGSKIGRTSVRPEGVRARDGAHQDAKSAKKSIFRNKKLGVLGVLAVNIFCYALLAGK